MSLLQLEGVSKKFGQVVVAQEITFQLEPGASVGIVGPNGAGKTSLFGMISGDIRPDTGQMLFDGQNVLSVAPSARCRLGMGRTYQVPHPFERMTAFENALLAAQQGARARGQKSYDVAYEALATGPRILLLDEIAGGLTDPEVNELITIIRSLREEGIAVLWIEHVVRALLSTVDRLLCLANGRLVADGIPSEVLASDEVRRVYLGGRIINEVAI